MTFYKGARFNEDLTQQVRKTTGLPATTQSNGLVDGLRTVNARRVAVATAYTDAVTERLKIFLEEHGFTVTFAKGLGYERIPETRRRRRSCSSWGTDAYAQSKAADALVIPVVHSGPSTSSCRSRSRCGCWCSVDASWSDERCAPARCQCSRPRLRNGAGKRVTVRR